MKKLFTLLLCLSAFTRLFSQAPTWSDNVASIIYDNCSTCHRDGGIGPFPLMSYDDAVTNGYSISVQVSSHLMPPWKPNPNYVHFQDERLLSEDDISTIQDWLSGGTPSGDLTTAPPPPVFASSSQMTSIDQTLQLPAWTVNTDIDQYRSFVIPAGSSAGKFLNQIEYQPGNSAIVHHIVIWADPTNVSQALDDADPLPGFESNGTMPASPFASLIGAWAPGSGLFHLPSNMGIKIQSNYDYVVEIHYAPGSNNQTDSTKVNLKFTDASVIREVSVNAILQYFFGMTDGPLYVPANTVRIFHEAFQLSGYDVSLLGVFPHMHKVGTAFKSWSLNAAGDTTRLIDIPKWSFHWQGFYNYQKLIPVYNGSKVWAEAVYDNTTNNADNPNNPPQDVYAGEHTTDEMMIGFFAYTSYLPGDENIILDSSLISGIENLQGENSSLEIFPNPAVENIAVHVSVHQGGSVIYNLYDMKGLLVKSVNADNLQEGMNILKMPVTDILPGMYLLKVQSKDGVVTGKFMKQ